MSSLPLPQRLVYAYLGWIYAFTRWTSTHTLLGMRFRTLILLASFLLVVVAWWQNWVSWAFWLTAILFVYLAFIYWRSARIGYFRFVPDKHSQLPEGDLAQLLPNEHVDLRVTGTVSVQSREEKVLKHSAEYWQVPLGDHIVMVKRSADRFLYQFFDAESLQTIRRGWLIHGREPQPALEVVFLSQWGPEFASPTFYLFGGTEGKVEPKPRALYFSFESEDAETAVLHNLIADARRVRAEQTDA